MESTSEVPMSKEWETLSDEAHNLSYYLAFLTPMKTHADPDTIKAYLGFDDEVFNSTVEELNKRKFLEDTTFRKELEKIVDGKDSGFAPSGITWTPEHAKLILANAPEETVLDDHQYRLTRKYEEFVKDKFETSSSASDIEKIVPGLK